MPDGVEIGVIAANQIADAIGDFEQLVFEAFALGAQGRLNASPKVGRANDAGEPPYASGEIRSQLYFPRASASVGGLGLKTPRRHGNGRC